MKRDGYPLEKNQDITLEITGVASPGSGVGHFGGVAVFVAGAAVGDTVLCRIIKTKKSYAVGKLLEVKAPSEDRIEPDCAVYGRCGGCCFRHITYESELRLKLERVAEAFKRIGGIDFTPEAILPSESVTRYRNKAQYPVRRGADGSVRIGFFSPRSHRVIDCSDCLLQPEEFSLILLAFRKWIEDFGVSVYDEELHTGLVRHICLRKAFATGEIMVTVVVCGASLPHERELVSMLTAASPSIKSIVRNENTRDTNVILGEKCTVLYNSGSIEDVLCGVRVRISPLSFYQVNRAAAQRLYEQAARLASLKESDVLLDLYCGAGTIGLSMARRVKRVIGVELVEQAVLDARENARINSIENAEFICADASKAAARLEREGVRPDVIIVDPPRKGLTAELIDAVARLSPDRLVYVSCDPATLARDAAMLGEKGYAVQSGVCADLFPRTAHVETVVLLSKGEIDSKKIRVEFSLEDMDLSEFQDGATYTQIKEYVLEHSGLKVSSLYISQIKRKCGIEVGRNYNLPKTEDARQPQCPPEKEKAIREAFKYFGMI